MTIAQDMYDEETYVNNLEVTKLREKESIKNFKISIFLSILGGGIGFGLFFYAPLYTVLPTIVNTPVFSIGFILIILLSLSLKISALWHFENTVIPNIILGILCSLAMLLYCIITLIMPANASYEIQTVINLLFPWNWITAVLLLLGYISIVCYCYKRSSIKSCLEKINNAKCIDLRRGLYFEDLEDRVFKKEIKKPSLFDTVAIGIGTLIMPFIQVAIIKSNTDTPTSALVAYFFFYLVSVISICFTINDLFKYCVLKEIQTQYSIQLKGACARRVKFRITLFRR